MVANKKVSGTARSVPAGIGIGTAVSLAITLAGALLTAWLVSTEKISEEAIGYGSMIILLAASTAGAYTAQALIKHQRLLMCVLAAICYFISLIAVTALFFGGQYQGIGVTALVIAAGAAIVVLTGLNGESNKVRKYRYG